MSERIISVGFEKQFIKSFSGYDDMDIMSIMFYDVEPNKGTEEGRMLPENVDTIFFNLDEGIVEAYSADDVVFSHKIKIVLDKSEK